MIANDSQRGENPSFLVIYLRKSDIFGLPECICLKNPCGTHGIKFVQRNYSKNNKTNFCYKFSSDATIKRHIYENDYILYKYRAPS